MNTITTKKYVAGVLLIATSVTLFSFVLPTAWFIAGSKPKSYDMGIDKDAGKDGKNAATIKSIDPTIEGFGTLMQDCLPGKYLGKRIRMTGWLRTKDVSDWSGLWLRIDTKTSVKAVVFDNMHDGKKDQSLKGTTYWKKYEIILDVPDNASNIAYGILLVGTGQIWVDNMNFEIVTPDIQTTGVEMDSQSFTYTSHQTEPTNLDFEK
jgi:hypothetical protein